MTRVFLQTKDEFEHLMVVTQTDDLLIYKNIHILFQD